MESMYNVNVVASPLFFLDVEITGVDDGSRRRRHLQLHTCFLCKRYIPSDRHLFMYRGDTAFCSEACRQEQVDMDGALAGVEHDAGGTDRHGPNLPRPRRVRAASLARRYMHAFRGRQCPL